MAIAHDASSESHTGTTGHSGSASYTWNHVGGASARFAVVFVFTIANAPVDTSVTYGGVSMTQIPYYAATNSGENGSVQGYFLDNCGTGTKAVVVNRTNNATVSYAVCMTGTAGSMGAEYYAGDIYTQSGTTTNRGASSTGATGTGTAGLVSITDGGSLTASKRYMGMHYGGSNILAAGTGSTGGLGIDYGLYVNATYHDTTPASGAQNVGSASGTDDLAVLAFAVRERIQVITLGLLDGAPALYAPTITKTLQDIVLPLLDGSPSLYAPTVINTVFANDDFSDTQVDSWGNADTGGGWASTTADFDKTGGVGTIVFPTTSGTRTGSLNSVNAYNHEGYLTWQSDMPLTGSGALAYIRLQLRSQTNASHVQGYVFYIQINQDGTIDVTARRRASSVDTTIATFTNLISSYATNTNYTFRWQTENSGSDVILRCKLWATGGSEPGTWQSYTDVNPGSSYLQGGAFRLIPQMLGNYTGSYPVTFTFDNLVGQVIPAAGSPQDLTVPLLDGSPALYAPTLVQTTTVTVPLLDGAPALYAPTILPQPVTITLGLLDSSPALYQPTVTPKNTLTVPLLDGAPELYAPTVTLAPYPITLGLLDSGPALYEPTVANAGGPPQGITLDLLDGGPALYAPSLTLAPYPITLGLLDSAPALYAPTVIKAPYPITLGLLDSGPALYQPTLTPKNAIILGLLDSGPALYQPTLAAYNTITLGLLDSGPALYAPSLAVGPVTISLPLLDGGPTLYPMILSNNTIFLPLLDGVPELYAPTLMRDEFITLPLLDGSPALYQPTLTRYNTLTVPLLDGGPTLYAPTLTRYNTLTLPLLDGSPALYAPVLAPLNAVILPLLDGSPALYAPVLVDAGLTLWLPLLDGDPALYAPVLSMPADQRADILAQNIVLQEFWPRKRKVRDPYTL